MWKPGTMVGRYRVVGPVGSGKPDGLFQVEDESNNTLALRSPIADIEDLPNGSVSARFLRDVQGLVEIKHLNVVPLFDVFVEKGYVCIISERVRGRSLSDALYTGMLPPQVALMLTRQILQGLVATHFAGRIHRNLSPSKILLVPMEGWELVKVADVGMGTIVDEALLEYGAAALTGSVRHPLATYMAPEQVRERSVDARTDIYAVGTILFELLAGRAPFPGRDPEHVKTQQLSLPPPKLTELYPGESWVTNEIRALVDTSLAKEREERFASAAQMIEALDVAMRSIR